MISTHMQMHALSFYLGLWHSKRMLVWQTVHHSKPSALACEFVCVVVCKRRQYTVLEVATGIYSCKIYCNHDPLCSKDFTGTLLGKSLLIMLVCMHWCDESNHLLFLLLTIKVEYGCDSPMNVMSCEGLKI